MSSSSSDSDSDEFEPIRRIKINIKPREEASRKVADVNEIKASVEAWRPLGPPTHPSLSRRQSSLSSVSSMSFGTSGSVYGGATSNNAATGNNAASMGLAFGSGLQPSPSCLSLVNDFNTRSSFSNFMSTTPRASSPQTHLNHSDPVPIAIAIQESIDLIVRGHYDPNAVEPKFQSRLLGNIKIAFPNAFARVIATNSNYASLLKLSLKSTENISRCYASRLIKDLDIEVTRKTGTANAFSHTNELTSITSTDRNYSNNQQRHQLIDLSALDPYSSNKCAPTPESTYPSSTKAAEIDMETLGCHLKKMHDQSPTARYYNVDVLRYEIVPIKSIEECPLQVCAYWKVESDLVKMRIDYKHSSKSGLKLEHLRDITFTADFSQFIPPTADINSLSPDSLCKLRLNNNNNNNNSGALDMNNFEDSQGFGFAQTNDTGVNDSFSSTRFAQSVDRSSHRFGHNEPSSCSNSLPPYITHEPPAIWNKSIKQLTWKFENLMSYHKTDGLSSLFAKLDFRNGHGMPANFLKDRKPTPVCVKFLAVDSTFSKLTMSIESTGYKMSFLKKEIRSGRYKSEPYIL